MYIADVSLAGSYLKTYNPATQQYTVIEQIRDTEGGLVFINDIAYNPVRDTLYGVEIEGDASTRQLVYIDRATGIAYRVGSPLAKSIHSMAVRNDGVMFAALQNNSISEQFVQIDINPANTEVNVIEIGTIPETPIVGMTFLKNGELIASHPLSSSETELLKIDPASGDETILKYIN